MPKQTIEYRCLLISPSDVSEERDALTELINRWNAHTGRGLNARIELVRWESHATPDMSDTAQNVLNKQLVDKCDLGIAVFSTRLGTPTATYPSGSVEEIYRLIQRGARVMVYFDNRPIPREALRDDQYTKLEEIRTRFEQSGLLATYSDVANLREQVNLHLTSAITELVSKDTGATTFIPGSGTMTAPTPDVRVNVRAGVAILPLRGTVYPLIVTVQNHSPITVFLGNPFFELRTGEMLVLPRDFLTEEWMQRRELRSGESFSLYVNPEDIKKYDLTKGVVCAAVKDDIDRVYRSTEAELRNSLKQIIKD